MLMTSFQVVPVANRMPKHIQMGTGFMTTTVTPTSTSTAGSDRPDLLTDHSLNRSSDSSASSSSKQAANLNGTMSSESSRISSGSGSNVGSYQLAMENIIDEYRLVNVQTRKLHGRECMRVKQDSCGATTSSCYHHLVVWKMR